MAHEEPGLGEEEDEMCASTDNYSDDADVKQCRV